MNIKPVGWKGMGFVELDSNSGFSWEPVEASDKLITGTNIQGVNIISNNGFRWCSELKTFEEYEKYRKEMTEFPHNIGEDILVWHGWEWLKGYYAALDSSGNYGYVITEGEFADQTNGDPDIRNFRKLEEDKEMTSEYTPKFGDKCIYGFGTEVVECLYAGCDIHGNHSFTITSGEFAGEASSTRDISNFRPVPKEGKKEMTNEYKKGDLPDVGIEVVLSMDCEITYPCGTRISLPKGDKVKVIAHANYGADDVAVIQQMEKGYIMALARDCFEPVKTKKQEVIDDMMECGSLDPFEFCEALYQEGYRKKLGRYEQISMIVEVLTDNAVGNEYGSTYQKTGDIAGEIYNKLNGIDD